MNLDVGGYTDQGLQRGHNEDAFSIHEPAEPAKMERSGILFAVADGMGGHLAGEVASQTAIEALLQEYTRVDSADVGLALLSAVNAANLAVYQAGLDDSMRTGMGTTLVAAVVRPGILVVAHVGDSPAFLIRNEIAKRLTQDHSWVAQAVAHGQLNQEDAETHPYRHVLTRALGSLPDVEVDLSDQTTIEPGDVLVLCSDGLVRHVKESELPEVVQDKSAADAAKALVDLANRRGGEDNTTVIVCKVLS